jgi:sugar lactone lactonase YvrE
MSTQERTELQTVLTGLAFPESPRWHDGRLWVSDWGAGEVVTVDDQGRRDVVARVGSFPMCIVHLPDGRLSRRLLRREPDGSLEPYADLSGLGEHPWNDIVADGRGNAYVNNIGFDFPDGEFAPGFVALVTPDGEVRQVADGLAFPNGMAVTADNRTLIVAESYGQQLTAFEIGADGNLSNRRVWAKIEDHPDGICLDADGAAWYGDVGTRRCVRVLEGGEVLQVINLELGCFACVLGGPDRRTLYMTVNAWGDADGEEGPPRGRVLATPAPAPGIGWP